MAKQQATATPSLQLDANVLSFLGITQQPFTANILSGDAIYTDATRDQMFATLQHHMQFSDLVLIVEGEQGSGKTTLFRQLIQNTIPNLFLISIIAETTDTLLHLQQKMAAHLKGQGTANYLDQDLKNLQVFDQFPIIIVDDAHVLSDTTLQELIRYRSLLKHDKETVLKILMFANPGMAATLEDISDLQHNQLYVQQMPALTPKQIQAFLEHRLSKAGYRGEAILTPETIQQIHRKSKGKPGQVMAMAALMIEKYVRNFNRGGGTIIKRLLAATAVLGLIAAAGYYWLNQTPTPAPKFSYSAPTTADAPVAPDESATPTDTASDTATTDSNTTAPATPTEATVEIPPDLEPAPVGLSSSGITPPANTAVVTPTEIKPHSQLTPTPAPLVPPAVVIVPKSTIAVAPAPVAAPAPATEPAVVLAPADNAELTTLGIKDSHWLGTQNPKHWTLQLLGARDTNTLVKYARQHKLSEDCAWYTTQLNGKPWYVLVHRFYTNADSARKGLELLPPEILRGQPWVKSVAAIQKDIAKAH